MDGCVDRVTSGHANDNNDKEQVKNGRESLH